MTSEGVYVVQDVSGNLATSAICAVSTAKALATGVEEGDDAAIGDSLETLRACAINASAYATKLRALVGLEELKRAQWLARANQ
jgi:hypothetical protein